MIRRGLRSVRAAALLLAAASCSKSDSPSTPTTPPSTNPPAATTAAITITFKDNPVPFRTSGCSSATPSGWYTDVRVEETAGVAFSPKTLTQKLDGNIASSLAESYSSRFGPCSGGTFDAATIPAKGAVCAVVGVCTTGSNSNYQFEITGTDVNGHALTFTSPTLNFSPR